MCVEIALCEKKTITIVMNDLAKYEFFVVVKLFDNIKHDALSTFPQALYTRRFFFISIYKKVVVVVFGC